MSGGLLPCGSESDDGQPTRGSGMGVGRAGSTAGAAAQAAAALPGQRVRVHYNLHRGGYSVLSTATGRVVAHVTDITLAAVRFRVQPAGLARIRAERRRAVCAYAIGTVAEVNTAPPLAGRRRVTFNPYRADTFTCEGEPIYEASEVVFADRAACGFVNLMWPHRCATATAWVQPAVA